MHGTSQIGIMSFPVYVHCKHNLHAGIKIEKRNNLFNLAPGICGVPGRVIVFPTGTAEEADFHSHDRDIHEWKYTFCVRLIHWIGYFHEILAI